jgi:hypothetical protein
MPTSRPRRKISVAATSPFAKIHLRKPCAIPRLLQFGPGLKTASFNSTGPPWRPMGLTAGSLRRRQMRGVRQPIFRRLRLTRCLRRPGGHRWRERLCWRWRHPRRQWCGPKSFAGNEHTTLAAMSPHPIPAIVKRHRLPFRATAGAVASQRKGRPEGRTPCRRWRQPEVRRVTRKSTALTAYSRGFFGGFDGFWWIFLTGRDSTPPPTHYSLHTHSEPRLVKIYTIGKTPQSPTSPPNLKPEPDREPTLDASCPTYPGTSASRPRAALRYGEAKGPTYADQFVRSHR